MTTWRNTLTSTGTVVGVAPGNDSHSVTFEFLGIDRAGASQDWSGEKTDSQCGQMPKAGYPYH